MVSTISSHEIPPTAEEVDLDRLVWDPIYREAVRHLIESREETSEPAPAEAAGSKDKS